MNRKFTHALHSMQAKVKKVNCQNTLHKGISILAGVMGGSIKCDKYNLNAFLKNRELEQRGK